MCGAVMNSSLMANRLGLLVEACLRASRVPLSQCRGDKSYISSLALRLIVNESRE